MPFHLSSRQAAVHARESGAGELVLTHIWPTLDRDVSKQQAAEAFNGPIDTAIEGHTFEVGS
jgi:ribonuclease BN (tRNA processing enzyme)